MSNTTDNSSSRTSRAYDARAAKRPREDETSDGIPNKYRIVGYGWRSRPEFQRSHLLRMDLDGIEEGNIIPEDDQEMDTRTLEDETAELTAIDEGQATLEGSQQMDCQTSQEHNVESEYSEEYGYMGSVPEGDVWQGHFEEDGDTRFSQEENAWQGYFDGENDGREYLEDDYGAEWYFEGGSSEQGYFNDGDGWGFGGGDGGCGGWDVGDSG